MDITKCTAVVVVVIDRLVDLPDVDWTCMPVCSVLCRSISATYAMACATVEHLVGSVLFMPLYNVLCRSMVGVSACHLTTVRMAMGGANSTAIKMVIM